MNALRLFLERFGVYFHDQDYKWRSEHFLALSNTWREQYLKADAQLREESPECFFTIADLRKRVAELETSLMESRRDCEIARLHLGSEMRSNSSLRGQITKLKGRVSQ